MIVLIPGPRGMGRTAGVESPDTIVYGDCGSASIYISSSGLEVYSTWAVTSYCGAIVSYELHVNYFAGGTTGTQLTTIYQ
jgi:hypothetical protein